MVSTKNERAGNGSATHAAGETVRAADLRATLISIGICYQIVTCEDSSLYFLPQTRVSRAIYLFSSARRQW